MRKFDLFIIAISLVAFLAAESFGFKVINRHKRGDETPTSALTKPEGEEPEPTVITGDPTAPLDPVPSADSEVDKTPTAGIPEIADNPSDPLPADKDGQQIGEEQLTENSESSPAETPPETDPIPPTISTGSPDDSSDPKNPIVDPEAPISVPDSNPEPTVDATKTEQLGELPELEEEKLTETPEPDPSTAASEPELPPPIDSTANDGYLTKPNKENDWDKTVNSDPNLGTEQLTDPPENSGTDETQPTVTVDVATVPPTTPADDTNQNSEVESPESSPADGDPIIEPTVGAENPSGDVVEATKGDDGYLTQTNDENSWDKTVNSDPNLGTEQLTDPPENSDTDETQPTVTVDIATVPPTTPADDTIQNCDEESPESSPAGGDAIIEPTVGAENPSGDVVEATKGDDGYLTQTNDENSWDKTVNSDPNLDTEQLTDSPETPSTSYGKDSTKDTEIIELLDESSSIRTTTDADDSLSQANEPTTECDETADPTDESLPPLELPPLDPPCDDGPSDLPVPSGPLPPLGPLTPQQPPCDDAYIPAVQCQDVYYNPTYGVDVPNTLYNLGGVLAQSPVQSVPTIYQQSVPNYGYPPAQPQPVYPPPQPQPVYPSPGYAQSPFVPVAYAPLPNQPQYSSDPEIETLLQFTFKNYEDYQRTLTSGQRPQEVPQPCIC